MERWPSGLRRASCPLPYGPLRNRAALGGAPGAARKAAVLTKIAWSDFGQRSVATLAPQGRRTGMSGAKPLTASMGLGGELDV